MNKYMNKIKYKTVLTIEFGADELFLGEPKTSMEALLAAFFYCFKEMGAEVLDLKVVERKCQRKNCREYAVSVLYDWEYAMQDYTKAYKYLLEQATNITFDVVAIEVFHMTGTRIR